MMAAAILTWELLSNSNFCMASISSGSKADSNGGLSSFDFSNRIPEKHFKTFQLLLRRGKSSLRNLNAGFFFGARPLVNASVKTDRRVEIAGHSPGLATGIFISKK